MSRYFWSGYLQNTQNCPNTQLLKLLGSLEKFYTLGKLNHIFQITLFFNMLFWVPTAVTRPAFIRIHKIGLLKDIHFDNRIQCYLKTTNHWQAKINCHCQSIGNRRLCISAPWKSCCLADCSSEWFYSPNLEAGLVGFLLSQSNKRPSWGKGNGERHQWEETVH